MTTCTRILSSLTLLSLLLMWGALPAAAQPAGKPAPVISPCDQPLMFGFGSWEKAKEAFPAKADGIHLSAKNTQGGAGGAGLNMNLINYGEWSPAMTLVVTEQNQAASLRLNLGDADGTSHTYKFDLRQLKPGVPQQVVPDYGASLAEPQEVEEKAGTTPGLDLARISIFMVLGDWSDKPIDVVLSGIVLVPPTDELRAGRVKLKELQAEEAEQQEFTSPRLNAIASWIGNSYGGGKKWVQQDIRAMTVMSDGTVFTNVYWDEAGGNAGEYRDGDLIRYAMHTHGWGYQGGEAVAANSRYVYLAVEVTNEGGGLKDPDTWPPKGSKWYGVSRRMRSDIAKGASFAGGKGGKGDTLKQSCLVVAEVPDKADGKITGICVDESRLYVADPNAGAIHVFDAETMQAVAKWKINRAGPLALDSSGIIWMLERKSDSAPARLVRFNSKGEEQSPPFIFAMDVDPIAFCVASDGRVFAADDSAAQQIRIVTGKGGTLAEVGVFGERGGIASGIAGAFGDRKLNHVTALGVDAKNNLIVAQDGVPQSSEQKRTISLASIVCTPPWA